MSGDFIRPGVRRWLQRWSETAAAAGVASLGGWWLFGAGGLLAWVGGAMAAGGACASVVAFQRARFQTLGGGVGVVQLDEGRLTYFGPLTGGTIAVSDIATVALDPRHRPPHWVLRDDATELLIPVDAEGAGALFDVFAQLPGLDPQAALAASQAPDGRPAVLWSRAGRVPRSRRLG